MSMIKKVKNKTGLSYTWVAQQLGITRQSVSQWFQKYSSENKMAQAQVMNIAIDEKIKTLNMEIKELEELKEEVRTYSLTKGENK